MRTVIESIEGEYRRYKHLAEASFRQLSEEQLAQAQGTSENSVATIAWHIAGNLRSRFTEFLDTDGESHGETATEFQPRCVSHTQLLGFLGNGLADLVHSAGRAYG